MILFLYLDLLIGRVHARRKGSVASNGVVIIGIGELVALLTAGDVASPFM